tara:strand:- start:263 stop:625 length:363 start_codon:yes stop_codon:yes gene_type:complete
LKFLQYLQYQPTAVRGIVDVNLVSPSSLTLASALSIGLLQHLGFFMFFVRISTVYESMCPHLSNLLNTVLVKPPFMIIQPMMQGISLSATVVFVTAISNGLSTYLLGGATLEEKIEGRLN